MAGNIDEEARALRDEQLDAMSPLDLADQADVGRGKLKDIDNRLGKKIAEEFMPFLNNPKIGVEGELSVDIDIRGRVSVCGALKTRTVEEGPMALHELPDALGLDNLQIDVYGSSTSPLLSLTFSLKDYIQTKRREGGFGMVTPVAEGDEALCLVAKMNEGIRGAGSVRDETPGDEVVHEGAE